MQLLQKKLYKIANEIVGNIGKPTVFTLSVTGEPYITFALSTSDVNEIETVWTNWVNAYILFKKYEHPEGSLVEREPQLTVFWRSRPIISKEDGIIRVYARLLISRNNISTLIPYSDF